MRPRDSTDPPAVEVEADRGMLMGVAYRLLGTTTDAADAVQDGFARWYRLSDEDRRAIDSPTGWLVTTVSRICVDMLRSARARREHYVGAWLPEPLPGSTHWTSHGPAVTDDPQDRVALDESVSTALLVVLESMTPAERVAFVLHDVFGSPFADISEILGRSEAACRQLATSARRRVRSERRRELAPPDNARAVRALKHAWDRRDLEAIVQNLTPDVAAISDGGGAVSAAIEPVHGAHDVARLLLDAAVRQPDLSVHIATVNTAAGLVVRDGHDRAITVISLSNTIGGIDRLWIVRNPDKLHDWH